MKEIPSDASIPSHKLLLKAGFIRQEISGAYTYLPLGWKVIQKIKNIIIEEMNAIGGIEILAPALASKDIWEATGRWEDFGSDMFKFKDRKNRDLCLAPTHEEIIATLVKNDFKSYRDLPKTIYQIQTKFRDEPRPRSGVIRTRQFIMKDSYSFDRNEKDLNISYNNHRKAYQKIFSRAGLNYRIVKASTGLMGGSDSEEFMIATDSGEDKIIHCQKCGLSSNVEIVSSKIDKISFPTSELKKVNTPVGGSVEEVSAFLDYPEDRMMKSLIWIINDEPVFLLLAGNDELSESKVENYLGFGRPAHAEEIINITGAPAGYVGPIGIKEIKIYSDTRLQGGKGLATGANEYHYHYTGVEIDRDFKVDKYLDLRQVKENELCSACGGKLIIEKAIEVGHIFKLMDKYSKALNVHFTDEHGKDKFIVMGSYGMGLDRIMASAIEQNYDKDGLIWPVSIAPFEVLILPVNMSDEKTKEVSLSISDMLKDERIDFILDDRDERAGVKFKDADLIGIPIRITIGSKNLSKGKIEIKRRDTGETELVTIDKVLETIKRFQHELYGLCSKIN